MKRLIFLTIIFILLSACERFQEKSNSFYNAEIVGFDLNCSTCILRFPDDSIKINEEIGNSQNNYYQTINLNKDQFLIGQKIKVKVRNSKPTELNACIHLYPSFDYKTIYIEDYENYDNLVYNDTIELAYQNCLNDRENQFYICLDSVINDSRCPAGLLCFWAGLATVRFKFERYNETPVLFNLLTLSPLNSEAIIDGFKFKLIDLKPYPSMYQRIRQEEYKARLIVTKE